MAELRILTEGEIGYTLRDHNFIWELVPDSPSLIIISVPHDGLTAHDLLGLLGPIQFNPFNLCIPLVRDQYVWSIVKDIARQTPVYAIRGLLPRCYIDFNRLWRDEEDSILWDEEINPNYAIGKELHDSYFEKIYGAIQRSTDAHERGEFGLSKSILLDLHGFSQQPPYGEYDIILGTRNGHTTLRSTDEHLADYLSRCGYRVFLPKRDFNKRDTGDMYQGGLIVDRCHVICMIDCVQVEIHRSLRIPENREAGIKLSNDLAQFLKTII